MFNFRRSSPATKIKHGEILPLRLFMDFTVLSLTCFPSFLKKCLCCFGCAVLISVLRNLAMLRGAEFHVWASLVMCLPPGPLLVCFRDSSREGTLATANPGDPVARTGFMYRTRAIACYTWKC